MKKMSVSYVFLVLFIGVLIGTMFSLLIGFIMPDNTAVKDFFLLTKSIGWGATENNWIDFGFIRIKTGLFFDVSILSVFGIFISWYILRYFK